MNRRTLLIVLLISAVMLLQPQAITLANSADPASCALCATYEGYSTPEILITANEKAFSLDIIMYNGTLTRQADQYAPLILYIGNDTMKTVKLVYTGASGVAQFDFSGYNSSCHDYKAFYCADQTFCGLQACFQSVGLNISDFSISDFADIPVSGSVPLQPQDPLMLAPAYTSYRYCPPPPPVGSQTPAFCIPLVLLVSLLFGSLYLSGRNPFASFDFTAPKMGKYVTYAARGRSLVSVDVSSAAAGIASGVSAAKNPKAFKAQEKADFASGKKSAWGGVAAGAATGIKMASAGAKAIKEENRQRGQGARLGVSGPKFGEKGGVSQLLATPTRAIGAAAAAAWHRSAIGAAVDGGIAGARGASGGWAKVLAAAKGAGLALLKTSSLAPLFDAVKQLHTFMGTASSIDQALKDMINWSKSTGSYKGTDGKMHEMVFGTKNGKMTVTVYNLVQEKNADGTFSYKRSEVGTPIDSSNKASWNKVLATLPPDAQKNVAEAMKSGASMIARYERTVILFLSLDVGSGTRDLLKALKENKQLNESAKSAEQPKLALTDSLTGKPVLDSAGNQLYVTSSELASAKDVLDRFGNSTGRFTITVSQAVFVLAEPKEVKLKDAEGLLKKGYGLEAVSSTGEKIIITSAAQLASLPKGSSITAVSQTVKDPLQIEEHLKKGDLPLGMDNVMGFFTKSYTLQATKGDEVVKTDLGGAEKLQKEGYKLQAVSSTGETISITKPGEYTKLQGQAASEKIHVNTAAEFTKLLHDGYQLSGTAYEKPDNMDLTKVLAGIGQEQAKSLGISAAVDAARTIEGMKQTVTDSNRAMDQLELLGRKAASDLTRENFAAQMANFSKIYEGTLEDGKVVSKLSPATGQAGIAEMAGAALFIPVISDQSSLHSLQLTVLAKGLDYDVAKVGVSTDNFGKPLSAVPAGEKPTGERLSQDEQSRLLQQTYRSAYDILNAPQPVPAAIPSEKKEADAAAARRATETQTVVFSLLSTINQANNEIPEKPKAGERSSKSDDAFQSAAILGALAASAGNTAQFDTRLGQTTNYLEAPPAERNLKFGQMQIADAFDAMGHDIRMACLQNPTARTGLDQAYDEVKAMAPSSSAVTTVEQKEEHYRDASKALEKANKQCEEANENLKRLEPGGGEPAATAHSEYKAAESAMQAAQAQVNYAENEVVLAKVAAVPNVDAIIQTSIPGSELSNALKAYDNHELRNSITTAKDASEANDILLNTPELSPLAQSTEQGGEISSFGRVTPGGIELKTSIKVKYPPEVPDEPPPDKERGQEMLSHFYEFADQAGVNWAQLRATGVLH